MEWRPIPRFPNYAASDQGGLRRIRTYDGNPTCKDCKPRMKRGYLQAHLCQDGRASDEGMHRLVWEAFRGEIPQGLQINHLNGVKIDNRLDNLELCTISGNALHRFRVLGHRGPNAPSPGSRNGAAKLCESDIPVIRQLCADGMRQKDVGAKYGISQRAVSLIARGEMWKHVPL
jgi:hypothetical protein